MEDFSKMHLVAPRHEQWAQDFAQQQQQQSARSRSWSQIWDEGASQTNQWASEFDQSQAATVCSDPDEPVF